MKFTNENIKLTNLIVYEYKCMIAIHKKKVVKNN